MALPPLWQLDSMLVGSWQLPMTDDYALTLTFMATRRFICTVSAATARERLRQTFIGDEMFGNWHVRGRRPPTDAVGGSVRGVVGGSVRRLTDVVAPPSERSRGKVNHQDQGEEGPFLVLNFTDLPASVLNFNAFGVPVKLGNWLNDLREIVSDDYRKILSMSKTEVQLLGHDGVEIWHKIGTPADQTE